MRLRLDLRMSNTHMRRLPEMVVMIAGILIIAFSLVVQGAQVTVTIATYSPVRYELLKNDVGPSIEKKHPGIKVKVETYPNYWTKLYTLATSDLAPDICDLSGGYLFDFVMSDAVVNLDRYVHRDLKMGDYFENPWLETRYPYRKGSCYAVPYVWVASLLYYNKDMFDASGLTYPDESWDWNRLLSVAQKLTRDTNGDGKIDQYGFEVHPDYYAYVDPLIRSYGGEVLNESRTAANIDSPGARKAVQLLVDMIHKYHVSPPIRSGFTFPQRGSAMRVAGSWEINNILRSVDTFDWDVAMVPKGPEARVIYGGSNLWSIMRRPSQDVEAVWTVMKELISEGALASFAGGWVPILRSPSQTFLVKWLEKGLPPANKIVLFKTAQYMRDADWSPGWSQWQAAKNREIEVALRGERSVEASLAAAAAAINQVLRASKAK